MRSEIFPPTRAAALARLAEFIPRGGRHYAANRNHDFGPGDRFNISLLSPYVRHRLITEHEIVAAILRQHTVTTAEKFIQEVVWRTYWKGWLEQRPQVWDRYVTDVEALQSTSSVDVRQRLQAAVCGQTGIDCFDAWSRELVETGYLHNHARMWFASLWIFTLKLPWQLGADFFLRHLLDGDAASNTLSWRWVGGLQTQGKTYLARADNIIAFTRGRFSVGSGLAMVAPPLPADDINPRHALSIVPSTPPVGPQILIVTEDDLGVESWPAHWADVQAVILLNTADNVPRVSAGVVAFKCAVLADTAARIRTLVSTSVPIATVTVPDAVRAIDALPPGSAFTFYESPIGPARTAFDAVADAIDRRGGTCHRLRRPWDNAFWPHATAGFFKVKDKIPATLRVLGLAV